MIVLHASAGPDTLIFQAEARAASESFHVITVAATQTREPHVLTQTSVCRVSAVLAQTGDEQRSVLNVPLRLSRLSVRMIPGLISPPDWI